jgi:radical SAM family uncharacterized protein/radical SAM-linked protein
MSDTSIQDILPRVQKPSRYLGTEVNRVKKSWEATNLHIALAFPDLYEIATSHFGIQILYTILNDREEILAERVFAPAADMEALLCKAKLPLGTLESGTPLHQFDIVGFSLLYELNYTNMVNMLHLGKIPLLSGNRDRQNPFIIAGGPCTCNPEPVADFFDAIVVGDGEAVILEMTQAWKTWSANKKAGRKELLKQWSRIKGVYIPSFFDVVEGGGSTARLVPKQAAYQKVERSVIADLNQAPFPIKPVVPFGKPVHDRLRMEIARGCTRGCRFCQAGMIYRPVRERKPRIIVDSIKQSLETTGYEDLSLLSLSTGDYSCIAPLMKTIMAFGAKDRLAVSLPSLRAGSLTPELMDLVKKVRKTGFTIAPEAGSQRLRDVINKNITEADIFETVENAFSLGWKLIKLYFMIGLPTETRADVEAIVDLVKRLKEKTKQAGRRPRINVSIATFVPKPHTPFQWESQIPLEEARKKLNWLKENLRPYGVHLKWQDPAVSMVEGVWARGDRKLNSALLTAWKQGCRFDGWSDFFDYDRWKAVFKASDIEERDYTRGFEETDQPLPWDHIDMGISRGFLLKERERALQGKITDDCRTGACGQCGVCNFKTIQPISFHKLPAKTEAGDEQGSSEQPQASFTYVLEFKKLKAARFLGHLEMVKAFIRSLKRARMPLKYSNGFHPLPKVSFTDTLPMGMQSEAERMVFELTEALAPEETAARIQEQLPAGFEATRCFPYHKEDFVNRDVPQHYHVYLRDGFFSKNQLDSFFDQEEAIIEKKNKKGKRIVVDLKKAVAAIHVVNDKEVTMVLGKDNHQTVRPALVLKTIFQLPERQILTATITKQKGSHV